MKKMSAVLMATAATLAAIDLSAIEFCRRASDFSYFTESLMAAGRFHRLLLEPGLWSIFPAMPGDVHALVEPRAMAFALVLSFGYALLWRRFQCRWFLASASVLAAACLPFVLAVLALRGNGDLECVGAWLVFSLSSFLYCQMTAFGFALIDFAHPKPAISRAFFYQLTPMGQLVLMPQEESAHPRN